MGKLKLQLLSGSCQVLRIICDRKEKITPRLPHDFILNDLRTDLDFPLEFTTDL